VKRGTGSKPQTRPRHAREMRAKGWLREEKSKSKVSSLTKERDRSEGGPAKKLFHTLGSRPTYRSGQREMEKSNKGNPQDPHKRTRNNQIHYNERLNEPDPIHVNWGGLEFGRDVHYRRGRPHSILMDGGKKKPWGGEREALC